MGALGIRKCSLNISRHGGIRGDFTTVTSRDTIDAGDAGEPDCDAPAIVRKEDDNV